MTNPLGDSSGFGGLGSGSGGLGGAGASGPVSGGTGRSVRRWSPANPLGAGLVMVVVLAFLWALELVDYGVGHWLDRLGIHALEIDGLPGIVGAPFLHAGFAHLASNSLPLLVLGWLVLVGGLGRFLVATLVIVVVSGLFAWTFTAPGTVIIGASGVIFGWLGYLLARGIFERKVLQILVALVVLVFYGGMIFGVLPGTPGVSWQAHLGGFVGGVGAAWLIGRRGRSKPASTPTSPFPPTGPTLPRT